MEALSAEERLWAAVRDWFEEPDGTRHAGPDVILDRLSTDDVERAWQILSSAADPLDPTATVWDEVDGREVSAVAALEGGVGAALARSASLLVPLRRVRAHGVELPWLGVFLYADAVALYWWVSQDEGWDSAAVAALVGLIDDVEQLIPGARAEIEWDDDGSFRAAIDTYLAERGSSTA